jgi:hypothetical protein
MTTALKIFNSILILFSLYMGIKHGWAMVSGKQEMLDMFGKWNIGKTGIMIMGALTLLGAVLILFPRTFLWGNFIMAANILFIIALYLQDKNLKGVAIEVPFFLMSLVILYLQHPLAKNPA